MNAKLIAKTRAASAMAEVVIDTLREIERELDPESALPFISAIGSIEDAVRSIKHIVVS